MVSESLTPEMIQAGARLTEQLDQAQVDVRASLWMYYPDVSSWRLLLAIPGVSKEGPKKIYKEVQTALMHLQDEFPTLTLSDIAITTPDNSLLETLRLVVRTAREISGIRFSRNTINQTYIEDSYIYRLL
jgi:hypothetical protein